MPISNGFLVFASSKIQLSPSQCLRALTLGPLKVSLVSLREERNRLSRDVVNAQEALYEADKPFRDIRRLEHRLESVETKYEALRGFVAGYNFKGVNLLERFDHEEAEKASHEKRTRRKTNNSKDEMER